MLKKLWNDEGGAIISAELILVLTVLFCGLAVGLVSLRDAVVTELADVGHAIGSLNQTYSFGGVTNEAHHAVCEGSFFNDGLDICDTDCSQVNVAPDSTCGIQVCVIGGHEG